MNTKQTTKKKRPDFYIVMHDKNGNTEIVGNAYLHGKGTGMNIVIGNKRYSAFAPKPKDESLDQSEPSSN